MYGSVAAADIDSECATGACYPAKEPFRPRPLHGVADQMSWPRRHSTSGQPQPDGDRLATDDPARVLFAVHQLRARVAAGHEEGGSGASEATRCLGVEADDRQPDCAGAETDGQGDRLDQPQRPEGAHRTRDPPPAPATA